MVMSLIALCSYSWKRRKNNSKTDSKGNCSQINSSDLITILVKTRDVSGLKYPQASD